MTKREIDTMINCHCKYLIETHDAFEWDGTLYIVMDLVKASVDNSTGPDMSAWLLRLGRYPTAEESATMIHHIAAAIHYLNQPPLYAIHRFV